MKPDENTERRTHMRTAGADLFSPRLRCKKIFVPTWLFGPVFLPSCVVCRLEVGTGRRQGTHSKALREHISELCAKVLRNCSNSFKIAKTRSLRMCSSECVPTFSCSKGFCLGFLRNTTTLLNEQLGLRCRDLPEGCLITVTSIQITTARCHLRLPGPFLDTTTC